MSNNTEIQSLIVSETSMFRKGILKKFFFGGYNSIKVSNFIMSYSMNVGRTLSYKGNPWIHVTPSGMIKLYVDGISIGFNNDSTVYFNGIASYEKVDVKEGFIDFCKEFSGIEVGVDRLLDIREKLNETIIEWNNLSQEDL
jgi:hypothetical protein